jgi:hypothetical protein
MSARWIVVNFPDGAREFAFPQEALKEGDQLWHEGSRYRVLHVGGDEAGPEVTVELDSAGIGDLLGSEQGGIVLVPAG